MRVRVAVVVEPATGEHPAAGADVEVQLRDTSRADAPSTVVASTSGRFPTVDEPTLEVELDVDDSAIDPRSTLTLFAQSIADTSEGRAKGDWITTESYPVRLHDVEIPDVIEVTLRQIR